jgi:phosphoglucosamine mutase
MIFFKYNTLRDNGIKFFNINGFKLDDEYELEIEDLIEIKDILHFLQQKI